MSTEHPRPASSDETGATPVVPEAGPGGSLPAHGATGATYGTLDPSVVPSPAGPGPRAYGEPATTPGAGSVARDFLSKLFDLSFTSFVTPSIVKVVYVLAIGVIGLGWLLYSLSVFARDPGIGLLVFLVVAPLVSLVCLVVVRIALELYLAVVRLAEDVRELTERGTAPE